MIKYEFLKGRISMLVLLSIAVFVYGLSLLGDVLNAEWLKIVSLVLLFMYAYAAYVYTLVRGITAYSAELRNRTGYLLMMTPRSAASILFGKLIFSFLLAVVLLVISFFCIFDVLANIFGSALALRGYYNIVCELARSVGIDPNVVIAFIFTALASTLINVLTIVSLGYLATTISATLFKRRRGRGFMTFLFFALLFIALMALDYVLIPEVMRSSALEGELSAALLLRQVLPILIFNLCATCGMTCLSALLLKKRVCL